MQVRRFGVAIKNGFVASVGVLLAAGLAVPASQQPLRAQAKSSGVSRLGGARGQVRSTSGAPIPGLMVQLVSRKNSIRTTVFTDELGKYEFPKLEAGEYVLRVPRPMEFRQFQKDPVQINGANSLPDIVLDRVTDSEFLPPTSDILPQLTEAEWLYNLPGTAREKLAFMNSCGGSCHGFQMQFRARFTEEDWRKTVRRMNYLERILVMPPGTSVSYDAATKHFSYGRTKRESVAASADGETESARGGSVESEIAVKWLAKARGPGAGDPPMKPFPRPFGSATRVVITEYELPWQAAVVHDVTGDAEGNIWFTINRNPFIGKLDPKTGKVQSYRIPSFDGIHPGAHWLRVDKQGMVWYSDTWSRSLGRLDPRTEKVSWAFTGLHGNVALSPDGSIWRTDEGKIKKYDPKTVMETGQPVKEYPLHNLTNTYGNFISRDGRYFGGGGRQIVFLDIETGEVREVPAPSGDAGSGRGDFDPQGNIWVGSKRGMLVKYDHKTNFVSEYVPPTPYTNFYTATADKNGEIWAGEMHGGRIARLNPRTSRWTEYVLPTPWSFDYNAWVDNSTDPVTYWYGDYYGYIVRVQPLE